jgi:DNA-binding protein HU-beta
MERFSAGRTRFGFSGLGANSDIIAVRAAEERRRKPLMEELMTDRAKRVSAKDVSDFLAAKLNVTKQDAAKALRETIAMLRETFAADGEVALRGLGRFKVALRSARTGRNPRTGEAVKVKARKHVTFKPSKDLRDLPAVPAKTTKRKK